MNRFFLVLCVVLISLTTAASLHAATIPFYMDSTDDGAVANMATTNAQTWGGVNNTAKDTLMEVIFDYTSTLDTLTHSTATSGAPTTPVVIWEAGGTGDGTALVLDGDNLVFFAGNHSDDFVSKPHGLSAGQNDVRVATSIDLGANALEIYVNGYSRGSASVSATDWAGSDTSALGQIGGSAIFQDGALAPFTASDVVNFNAGADDHISFSAHDATAAGFDITGVFQTVFRTGFEYRTEPTMATLAGDAANLDVARGQIGSFSGTLATSVGSTGKIGFDNNNRDGGRLFTNDRPASGANSFFADLAHNIALDGAVVSFDAATRRTENNSNAKDYAIIGKDRFGNEAFHLVVDTDNNGSHERLVVLYDNGTSLDTRQEALIATFGGTGADADEDFTNTGGVPSAAELGHVELNLSGRGYTITFDRNSGARAYTTGEIPYNSRFVSGLSTIEFAYSDGGTDATRSGYYVDNIFAEGKKRPIVFYNGFEYSGGEPTPGTDAAGLNGADDQVGSFSGTVPTSSLNAGELFTFSNGASDRVLEADRPIADATFYAELLYDIPVNKATVSFNAGTTRTVGNSTKDWEMVGLDKDGNESFHLLFSADNTANVAERLAVITDSGATTTYNLPTVSGADADDDLPNVSPDFTVTETAWITLNLADSGFTIDFSRTGTRAYTTSTLDYNGSATELSKIKFFLRGHASDDGQRAGMFIDNLLVTIPEPSTFVLAAVGLLGLLVSGRRMRRTKG